MFRTSTLPIKGLYVWFIMMKVRAVLIFRLYQVYIIPNCLTIPQRLLPWKTAHMISPYLPLPHTCQDLQCTVGRVYFLGFCEQAGIPFFDAGSHA